MGETTQFSEDIMKIRDLYEEKCAKLQSKVLKLLGEVESSAAKLRLQDEELFEAKKAAT